MRTLKALQLVSILLLGGCSSSHRETTFLQSAALSHLEVHRDLAANLTSVKFRNLGDCFVLDGHSFRRGEGLVLRVFNYGHTWMTSDTQWFEYLSIYIPEPRAVASNVSIPRDGIAFFSGGSRIFPSRSGCTGYATGGSVRYEFLDSGRVQVRIALDLELASPRGFKEECRNRRFEGAFLLRLSKAKNEQGLLYSPACPTGNRLDSSANP
jgi:hypothetical protein